MPTGFLPHFTRRNGNKKPVDKTGNKTEAVLTMRDVTVIIPSNIHVMLTGAWRLEIGPHDATLTYTDGTTETIPADRLRTMCALEMDNWLTLVSAVQSQRSQPQKPR